MTKLNSLARARVIVPEGGAEDGAADAGVGEGAVGVDVLVVSSSRLPCFLKKATGLECAHLNISFKKPTDKSSRGRDDRINRGGGMLTTYQIYYET
jgi:hypothetical protein